MGEKGYRFAAELFKRPTLGHVGLRHSSKSGLSGRKTNGIKLLMP